MRLLDLAPVRSQLGQEVLSGLLSTPRSIAPKFLYDRRGSELFELITALPEYYLTRAEFEILRVHAGSIAAAVGPGRSLIEFGSGNSTKIRLLLDALAPRVYVPVDISLEHLEASAREVRGQFPWLTISPVCADYSQRFEIPEAALHGPRIAFFPGSSIGNFEPSDAIDFLANVADLVGRGGQLLIGVDLKKDRATLERAYNDVQGVSAAFNRNVLVHLNERFEGTFDPENFDHRARYDEIAGRIEIHLVSRLDQIVSVCGRRIALRRGEEIHTENSYKYLPEEFDVLAGVAGFERRAGWFDSCRRFAVLLYEVGSAATNEGEESDESAERGAGRG